jgi:hypothetical protein
MFDRPDSGSVPLSSHPTFGARLRAERERRGIALVDVAQRTKVHAAIFSDLERDDFSRWPPGIFGRSFVRAYADAVGLEPDDVIRAYLRVHPDGEPAPPMPSRRGGRQSRRAPFALLPDAPAVDGADDGDPAFRLTLDDTSTPEGRVVLTSSARQRRFAAALDVLVVAVLAGVAFVSTGAVVFAGIALYFGFGTLVLGSTPALWYVTRRSASLRVKGSEAPSPRAAFVDLVQQLLSGRPTFERDRGVSEPRAPREVLPVSSRVDG